MKRLCAKNNCELVIVPHNLTNKFQPLDISINQSAKKLILNKFNTWYADRVSKQFSYGVAPGDVKVSQNNLFMLVGLLRHAIVSNPEII